MNPTAKTEIRFLRLPVGEYLARQFLDAGDGWKRLASVIPVSPNNPEPLYTAEEIRAFSSVKRASPTLKLLEDWGLKGKIRPTVELLIQCLLDCEHYGAASYLAVDVLKGEAPPRPERGVASDYQFTSLIKIDDTFTSVGKAQNNSDTWEEPAVSPNASNPESPPQGACGEDRVSNDHLDRKIAALHLPPNMAVTHVPFEDLFKCTRAFSPQRKLGQGAFGAVYLGDLTMNGKLRKVAVKKLKIGEEKQFNIEIQVMTRYVHKHLLEILGFSCDNPVGRCLISALMVNGSLEDRLAQKRGTPPLPWNLRIDIAIGTAKGLVALHTMYDEPLVHRDIKSANILLDEKFVAKIGDFGIARMGADWRATTKLITSQFCGTPVYMAEEALRGSVTEKLDTFSFGVVLLELLTGLPPFDGQRTEPALVTYVEEEKKEAEKWSDPKAGQWPLDVANSLFDIAVKCNERRKNDRPLMQEVLPLLEALQK